jgi:hypothetical protein
MRADLPPPPHRRFVFPVLAGLITAVCFLGGIVATSILSWLYSVCGDEPSVIASDQATLRVGSLLIRLTVGAIPLGMARAAHRRHKAMWPWISISSLFVLLALFLATTLRPSTWCLY